MSDRDTAAKKHKRSSSDLSVDQLYSLTDGLTSILCKIEEAKSRWGDLEELRSLSDETKCTITQVKITQNLKKKDPDAVIVSLSNMDEKILRERLGLRETETIGVGFRSPVVFLDKLLPALKAQSAAHRLDIITGLVNDHWKHALSLDTLWTIDTTVNKKVGIISTDTLNIYEAKRASESLQAHQAQVIAQCLAIMAKWNASHDDHIRKLPFTLTTGSVWLFGLVDSERMTCMKTAEMSINIQDLKIAAEGKDLSDQSIQALMTLILIWSTQTGDAIQVAMSTLQ
ncbi:hypothetical protein C0993_001135 [Termitomyces sp. T159_Od127]|nr:hypothetical protein C0993_001135 [Termitomyces sp. T159_Od127]